MKSQIVASLLALFAPLAAHAAASDGACRTTPDAMIEVIDIFESLPVREPPLLVSNPGPRVTLCDGAPVVFWNETFDRSTIEVRVPLAALDTRPLSTATFAREITAVSVPAPWSFGTSSWRLEGEGDQTTLVLALEEQGASAPSAWVQAEAIIAIRLASGQNVLPRIAFGSVISDETLNARAGLRRRIEFRDRRVAELSDAIATAQSTMASPQGIVTGNEEEIASLREKILSLEREAAALLARAEASFATADDPGAVIAILTATNDFPDAEASATAFLDANNARVQARTALTVAEEAYSFVREIGAHPQTLQEQEAAVAAARAALATADTRVAAARAAALAKVRATDGMMTRVLEAWDTYQGPGSRRLGDVRGELRSRSRWLATLLESDAADRAHAIDRAKADVEYSTRELDRESSERTALQKELDAMREYRRSTRTRYETGCPAS